MEKVPADSNYFVERTLELVPFSPANASSAPPLGSTWSLGPSAVAVADFNNDQKQDLVVRATAAASSTYC